MDSWISKEEFILLYNDDMKYKESKFIPRNLNIYIPIWNIKICLHEKNVQARISKWALSQIFWNLYLPWETPNTNHSSYTVVVIVFVIIHLCDFDFELLKLKVQKKLHAYQAIPFSSRSLHLQLVKFGLTWSICLWFCHSGLGDPWHCQIPWDNVPK